MPARIGVVVFPGTNCEHDTVLGARATRSLRRAGLARGSHCAGLRRARRARWVRPRRLPAPRCDRPVLAGHGRGRRVRRLRGPGGRYLQRLPGADRGRAASRGLAEEPGAALPVHHGDRQGRVVGLGADPGGGASVPSCSSPSTTSRATTRATPTPWPCSVPRTGSSCATSATRTDRSTPSPGCATRAEPSSASCPTPSEPPTRSPARWMDWSSSARCLARREGTRREGARREGARRQQAQRQQAHRHRWRHLEPPPPPSPEGLRPGVGPGA